ncbi:MAG: diacylglycerol kinase [Pseudomonadales bacterium]|nr:diacylglycerol kinase [Pseudomonadales bacterium]
MTDPNQEPGAEPAFDKTANTGFAHLRNATRFSLKGLQSAFRHESAFRQEVALLVILVPVAIWLARSLTEAMLLISVCLLVMVVELLNSGIEAAIDRIGPEFHELSGRAKDLGSAAVMLALIIAGGTWLTFLYERFTGS